MSVLRTYFLLLWSTLGIWASSLPLCAQQNGKMDRAEQQQPSSKKTLAQLKEEYEKYPGDQLAYEEYLQGLLDEKNTQEAERIVQEKLKYSTNNPSLFIDLGSIYVVSGKEKKAVEFFDKAIALINGDDMLTQKLANKFERMERRREAIKTYERAIEIMRFPALYALPLGRLYAQEGRVEEAILLMISGANQFREKPEDLQANLLEVIGEDEKKLQLAQKGLVKAINLEPDNQQYAVLLTWLYTQKNDWEGALQQIRALDLRNKEEGRRLINFAREAREAKQYDVAHQALDAVAKKGESNPLQRTVIEEKINLAYHQISRQTTIDDKYVTQVIQTYKTAFDTYQELYSSEALLNYTALLAQYAQQTDTAIALLEKALLQPVVSKYMNGYTKLLLGDYLIIKGKVWDASLYYSQVDKAFREDVLGEEARFRNAKLAYYRGDFTWAQGQLDVLKSATSELIANDALDLSVLITENITPDSNYTPLLRFAHADLLLFQNQDKEAIALLDSISTAFPEHPLQDDILLLKSKLALKHHKVEEAIKYLQQILDKHKEDVLADDALFRMANIYDQYLKKPDVARKYYERLVLEYMGSTYVQEARKRISAFSL